MIENRSTDAVWELTAPPALAFPELSGREHAEVAIVGGGFCGLSAALHLGEAEHTVAVLESEAPGWGASGRNGGQVIPGLKNDPDDLCKRYGTERGEALATLAGGAPDLVFDLIRRYGIECGAQRSGWIQLASGPRGLAEINNRVWQWRQRNVDVEVLDQSRVQALTGARGYTGGLLDKRGGNLNPLAYARGLAAAASSTGIKIYGHSQAVSLERKNGKWVITAARGTVTSDKVLLCTNAYTDGLWPGLKKTIVPFVSGAIATQPLPERIRETILRQGQAAADNARLLSWFGLDGDGRLIFGGRTRAWSEANTPTDYKHRIKRMHAVFPQVEDIPVQSYWSGKVALTVDYMPRIHNLGPGLYTGLGFNGRGVAMATLMGKLLAECIDRGPVDVGFDLTEMKTLPLHGLRRPVVQLVVNWKQLMDRVNP